MEVRGLTVALLGATIVASGCHLALPGPVPAGGAVAGARTDASRVAPAGRVEIASHRIQDAASDRMAEIAKGATVSLIRTDNGQTVASAITDDQGRFVMAEMGSFTPVTDQPYLLEAVKGLKASDTGDPNAVGAAAARLRTLIVWKDGWTSFRNKTPGPLTISIGTTGLVLLVRSAALDAVQQRALVGSMAAGDAFTLPAGVPASVATDFDAVWSMVRDALSAGQDPVAGVALPGASDAGALAGRAGPPLSVARANPASLEPGSSITFHGRGFSKVVNENVLWVRPFSAQADVAIGAAAVAADGSWARFDAPGSLPVPGPWSRYRLEVRQASGQGQTTYDVPAAIARPAVRPGVLVALAGDASYGGAWREGSLERARFWGPSDVKLDAAGNLFVCEHWYGNRIRVLAKETGTFFGRTVQAGQVATVVGTGHGADLPRASRWNGDKAVLETNLSLPWNIALDPQGNLLITDYDVSDPGAKFRVAARADGSLWGTTVKGGWVTTLAVPTGSWGARGVASDAQGNLYYYDWAQATVRFVPKTSGTHWGQAMNANTSYAITPSVGGFNQLWVDPAGNLLVAGSNTVRILAKTAGTHYNVAVPANTLTTIAGNGTGPFDGDGKDQLSTAIGVYSGVVSDLAGNLYISDERNHRVRVVAAANGSIQVPVLGTGGAIVPKGSTSKGKVYTLLGTGTAASSAPGTLSTAAAVSFPYGLDMDASGGLYVVDSGGNRIVYVGTR